MIVANGQPLITKDVIPISCKTPSTPIEYSYCSLLCTHLDNIRNFCIIAHIDHGKSTLADRFLEYTGTVERRNMRSQLLDTMELEQERGITIKLQPVRMEWSPPGSSEKYIMNLIDTPGHSDFSYEVSRSLAACEGAILVVDATQGIEAQTLSNLYMALEHDLTIIPVLNKIDLPAADVEKHSDEIENILAIPREEIIAVSAKEGTNIDLLLQAIIDRIPSPNKSGVRLKTESENDAFSKALIFDSVYDTYKGVVAFVRDVSGTIKKGDTCYLLGAKQEIQVQEVGYFKPKYQETAMIQPGEVGYIVTGLRSVGEARVGDTIWKAETVSATRDQYRTAQLLPGYKKVHPMVFAGIFCTEGDDYHLLRTALEKLSLNDSALTFEPEQSAALGFGYRCGFLGLLHMEIVQERLEREYDLDLIVTAPSVSYKIIFNGDNPANIKKSTGISPDADMSCFIPNPSELPDRTFIKDLLEPWIKLEIICVKDNVGAVMKLVDEGRGVMKKMNYLDDDRVHIEFEIPLASVIVNFHDSLKSVTKGYASMSYEFLEYRAEDLVKLDILIADERVDALSLIVHRTEAHNRGKDLALKLKEVIPKAQFAIALQAAIGGKIVARETIPALRKDVIAGLYGGDRTRKDKLLKKQKAGKKRMRMVGRVELPQAAFLAILKR